ncbi:hypothetical protein WAK64_22140 [Bacillus spongiae]|uniref:ABC transporter permease n=1 Tax=Bacillus spongiae TaxID=2683610 RepID=A0ABU8HJY0_9BACI
MRILLNEMKKIFHPIMLLIAILINVLMYNLFIDIHISNFLDDPSGKSIYRIGIEMIEKYGHELDEHEFADFKLVYQQEVKKADKWIQENQELSDLGIASYKEFREVDIDINSDFEKVRYKIVKGIDLFREIPLRESIIERMEFLEERYGYSRISGTPTKEQELRIKEVVGSRAVNSFLPDLVQFNFFEISKGIMITILVSVLFIVSPIFIKDYKNKLVSLQYTSAVGRSLFKWKVAAGLLSAFIITTVQIIVYYSIYSTIDIGMFLKSGVNSFMGSLYWYDVTFLQLIMVTLALTYVLALSVALMAIVVSSICKNYISIIGIQLPIFVIICFLVLNGYLLSQAFYLYRSQLMVAALYSVIVFLPLIATFWKWRREKKQDILY